MNDERTVGAISTMIIAVLLIIGVLSIGGYAMMRHQQQLARLEAERAAMAQEQSARAALAQKRTIRQGQLNVPTFKQQKHVELLRKLLQEKETLVAEQQKLLNQRRDEQIELQDEIDAATELIERLAGDATGGEQAQVKAELAEIKKKLETAKASEETVADRLKEVESKLAEREKSLGDLREDMQVQMIGLASEHESLRTVTRQILGAMGEDAETILVGLLTARSAESRRWAAVMLGESQSDSKEVVDGLKLAVDDENAAVSKAATKALDLLRK